MPAVVTKTLLLGAATLASEVSASAGNGAAFLGQKQSAGGITDMLAEIEKVAGKDHREVTENRATRLERALKPMFAAMPKDSDGRLDAAGVRYLLHRLFVQRHGWFVNGLDNGGGSWDSSSPTAVFAEHASEQQNLFEGHLQGQGFTLHQVAVFAATLETLVHGDHLDRLQAAYMALGMTKSETLTDEEASEALRAYMVMYVMNTNITSVTRASYEKQAAEVHETYPTFRDTEDFVAGIRQRILEDTADGERLSWETNLKVVEEVAERYGRWQAKECHTLKGMLLDMEQPGTGRVRLQDFYGQALSNSSWQFVESVPYLRSMGALDDSNPEQLSVIIPNYINSPANCVASSKFYSVCCIDECEDLLGHLETKIAAPEATPEEIIAVVAGLPSDTVQAPRSIPDGLLQRLTDIAVHHDGKVPLHGRLFAQWMHHAYPRECQFPHISGTTNPLTQEAWVETTDTPIMAGEDDIRSILEAATVAGASTDASALPWTHEEELFSKNHALPKQTGSGFLSALTTLVLPLAGVAAFIARNYAPSKGSGVPSKSFVADKSNHKYYV